MNPRVGTSAVSNVAAVTKIGLGVTTWRRPGFYEVCARSITEHLGGILGWAGAYHDGPHRDEAEYLLSPLPIVFGARNKGVAAGKNWLLSTMLAVDCDWLIVMEDDQEVLSPEAVTGYVAACEASGLEHLSFHAHGPANPRTMGIVDGPVTYWPNLVGALAIYSNRALLQGGLLDEHFVNAHEHCEHTQRLAERGFTTPWPRNADATGSEKWLREQPGSIEGSVIRQRPDWNASRVAAKDYWRRTYPSTFAAVFGAPVEP
jgi:hypothetical protein